MTQSPPRSAAQLGRVRRGPFGFASVSSQLPPPGTGQHPNPGRSPPQSIPLPQAGHPGQPGAHPFCHPLPRSEHLLQMGSFISTTTSLSGFMVPPPQPAHLRDPQQWDPDQAALPPLLEQGPPCRVAPEQTAREPLCRGCRTDTGGMPEGPCPWLAVPLAPPARDPPRSSTRARRASAGRRAQQSRLSRSSASCLPPR